MTETIATERGADAFDFLFGRWNVANRRLFRPLSGSTDWEEFPATSVVQPLFGGRANVDEIEFPTRGFTGLTLRLYDADRGEWTLHWADTHGGQLHPPVVGRFDGDRGEFHGTEVHDGTLVGCRFVWSDIAADSARWEQAFQSPDGTWETNWVMELSRA